MTNRFPGGTACEAHSSGGLRLDPSAHSTCLHTWDLRTVRAIGPFVLSMKSGCGCLSLVRCEGAHCGGPGCLCLGQHWVEDQIAFHESRAHRWGGRSQALELTGNFLFALTLLAALAHLGVPKAHEDWSHLLDGLAIAVALLMARSARPLIVDTADLSVWKNAAIKW